MISSKTVSFLLPQVIFDALAARAKATDQSKTDIIVHILAQAFGLPTPSPARPLQQRISTLEQRVFSLEERVAALFDSKL